MKTAIKQRLASVLSTLVGGSCKKGAARFIFALIIYRSQRALAPQDGYLLQHASGCK